MSVLKIRDIKVRDNTFKNMNITVKEKTIKAFVTNNNESNTKLFYGVVKSIINCDDKTQFIYGKLKTDNYERNMVFISQTLSYNDVNVTVLDYLKIDISPFKEIVNKYFKGVDIGLKDKKIKDTSMTEKILIETVRILVKTPKLIVIDDILISLDDENLENIMNVLDKYKNENNSSVLIFTSQIKKIIKYCDDVDVIKNGTTTFTGTVKEFYNEFKDDTIINTPKMSKLMHSLNKKCGLNLPTNISDVEEAVNNIAPLISNKDIYVVKNSAKLRYGYTTGSCATAVSVASLMTLITQKENEEVFITLPSKEKVRFSITIVDNKKEYVKAMVIKFAGDDPDVTDKAKIYAKVSFNDSGEINLKGGHGVGVVTEEGLRCEVGEPAINPVPRKMITENCKIILNKYGINKGVDIEISVKDGEEIAKKTFNEKLGIKGGISILGTTGIVEPMSEKALIETIKIMIDKQYLLNKDIVLISPGNYGEDFCKNILKIETMKCEKISNYIGETLDYIRYKGFKKILFVGHIGKIVKISAGIMNTHSSMADCRLEMLALYTAVCGGKKELVQDILNCLTTQKAIDILSKQPFCEDVMKKIMERIIYYCNYRLKNEVEIAIITFDNSFDNIVKSENTEEILKLIKGN